MASSFGTSMTASRACERLMIAAICVGALGGCPSGEDPPPPAPDSVVLPMAAACAVQEAEHPMLTTTARDVALCGGVYSFRYIGAACSTAFHVCTVAEWSARYTPGTWPCGPVTTWGRPQSERCRNVWLYMVPQTMEKDPSDDCAALNLAGFRPRFAVSNGLPYIAIETRDRTGDEFFTQFSELNTEHDGGVYCCRN